ncbi:MBL fold metallo-hydrolase [Amphibacillus cookii]|uniref:MBL fold metallo-hydrolase n=1 Tax=Amphibacillus cookii TaxID=767787 RepID=UPI00195D0F46|nr:MBL fold metallo-hydrolase [Amphibacillus cookii]MBM7542408.1 glyoxylase-like metal-dependent hydrolase (beta-lactamase superfamily II) [Amphibacillus cookii]
MHVETMSLGQLGTNGYIIYQDDQAIIIDPGAEAERIRAFITKEALNPIAILLTHAHFDHIGAVDEIRDTYSIPVYLHESEAEWLTDPSLNSSKYFPLGEITARPADGYFKIGKMVIGSFKFEVVHTPGHSPGGVSFIFETDQLAFVGDCLFRMGIGRTDLPGGDHVTLIDSVRNKIYRLDANYKVLSGHGPETTIGYEKVHNPFVTL